MRKSVLLCEPSHYNIRYAINPWMSGQSVNTGLAKTQFDGLVAQYRQMGLTASVIQQDPDQPDMVFTANAGLLIGDTFIPSNFRYPERVGESALFAEYFSTLGKKIYRLDPELIFEGAGDALFVGDKLIMGYGFRSVAKAAEAVRGMSSSLEVLSVGLSNPYFYHLDTCLSPLPSGRFIFYPDAFDDRSRKILTALGGYWVTERFCVNYGCNMVALNGVAVTPFADQRFHEIADAEGLTVVQLDVSEFIKAGGGVRCLSFLYD